jgi:hypothetical protein
MIWVPIFGIQNGISMWRCDEAYKNENRTECGISCRLDIDRKGKQRKREMTPSETISYRK